MQSQNESQQTGTTNETYNVIAILYHALQGAENCQIYLKDAQDDQAREFFEQALQSQRQLADRGKEILQQVLQNDTGGSSAFGWGKSQSEFGSSGQGQSGFGSGQSRSAFSEQKSGQDPSDLAGQNPGQTTGGGNF